MSRFSIKVHQKGRCRIRHLSAGTEIITDLPPEYGGLGRSFSSTDLVSAALGSCILSTIDTIFEREGYDPGRIEIIVVKSLAENPRRIKSITLEIFYPETLSDLFQKKLTRAMSTCPVKRSLHSEIEITTRFKFQPVKNG